MTQSPKNILKEALQLPVNVRAELAAMLIDSLDTTADGDTEAAWGTEIAKRIGDLDRQSVSTIPWHEVRRKILGNAG